MRCQIQKCQRQRDRRNTTRHTRERRIERTVKLMILVLQLPCPRSLLLGSYGQRAILSNGPAIGAGEEGKMGSSASRAATLGCTGTSLSTFSNLALTSATLARQSALPTLTDKVQVGLDHPLAVLVQPLTIASHEVDLMLAALLQHRPDAVDRMCTRHLREKFG